MKRNVGAADKTVRIILGLVLLGAVFFVEGSLRWFGLVGVVPLLTGLMGYCPLYRLVGFTSCPIQKTPS